MQQLKKVIETLRASQYLNATIDTTGNINDLRLLENGIKYSEQLLKHWRQSHTLDKEAKVLFMDVIVKDQYDHSIYKYNFINTVQFQNGVRYLKSTLKNPEQPVILKSIHTINTNNSHAGGEDIKQKLLITDVVIHPSKALSNFFNAQRACKIWWMRLSSDPGKYFLESYNFNSTYKTEVLPGTQSIAIKTKFPYATFTVEDITYVPLDAHNNFRGLTNKSETKTEDIPGVIRSVIDLKAAASAIIFDSVDNDREKTLMLSRKLAPYQCAVACYNQGKNSNDLKDLHSHLNFVLERARLRLMKENIICTQSQNELEVQYKKYDSLGIPYSLIIDENTLNTGLLKLRSRDTTLEEIIHISDIPEYLLQIFNS